ncbi:hypothetical protein AVEN_16038-1 [Araneus ventricosus]|uniref:Uncharacterized protein n=1 Tax=Araneus ventricosus TaxID=182803 RepID=A0A4Y2Q2S3_ARAVE|nr:hypothetical protein AVEN_16038-1 [Araneus ventricosus]
MWQREESICFGVSGGCGYIIAGSVKQCFGNVQCTGNFPNIRHACQVYETSCIAIHSKLRIFRSWFLLTCQSEKFSPCIFLLEWKWTMHGHRTFCGQTRPIYISKVLLIPKIEEYGQERIRSKCIHCLFMFKVHMLVKCCLKPAQSGGGLRQHLTLALSVSKRLVLRVL